MDANSPPDVGCIVDGHTGQYAGALLIDFARTYGFSDKEALDLADRQLAAMGLSSAPGISEDEEQILVDAVEDAIDWLNEAIPCPRTSLAM